MMDPDDEEQAEINNDPHAGNDEGDDEGDADGPYQPDGDVIRSGSDDDDGDAPPVAKSTKRASRSAPTVQPQKRRKPEEIDLGDDDGDDDDGDNREIVVSREDGESEDDGIEEISNRKSRAARNLKKVATARPSTTIAGHSLATTELLKAATVFFRCIAASEDPWGLVEGQSTPANRAWALALENAPAVTPDPNVAYAPIVRS